MAEGRLSQDVILGVASLSLEWQDSLVSYFRSGFFYNSYLINVSSWDAYIPGWVSPNADHLPQPLFVSGFGYLLNIPMALILIELLKRVSAPDRSSGASASVPSLWREARF